MRLTVTVPTAVTNCKKKKQSAMVLHVTLQCICLFDALCIVVAALAVCRHSQQPLTLQDGMGWI